MRNINEYNIFTRIGILIAPFLRFIMCVIFTIQGVFSLIKGNYYVGIMSILIVVIFVVKISLNHKDELYIGKGKIVIYFMGNEIYYKNGVMKTKLIGKCYKNEFQVNELREYSFSRELCGKRHMSFSSRLSGKNLEIVFVLKNNKVISYNPILIKPEGYKNLVEYIRNETGIEPSKKIG